MDLVKIGQYIAGKRKDVGLTQRQLAERLNMSDKSVSKWERGVCLPNVSVYQELCDILGISINEFLAGEDISEENIAQKSEDNLMQVTRDGDQRARFMKRVIAVLSVIAFVAAFVLGHTLYRYFSQPRNYIVPVDRDSAQMKTAELLAGVDGAYLYRYVAGERFGTLTVYVSEYQDGELVSKETLGQIGYDDVGSPSEGMIAVVPDFDTFTVRLVVADDGSKLSTDLPILEGVKGRKYYGRSVVQIDQMTETTYGAEQGVLALLYGKDAIHAFSLANVGNVGDSIGDHMENQYVYYISLEFGGE